MIYVRRDASGKIAAVSQERDAAHPVAVEDDSPEVAAFFAGLGGGALAQTDLGLVRVLEDLLDVLIEKAIIRFTDLPVAAQAKLIKRRSLRSSLRVVDLLGDDESDVVRLR